MCFQIYNFYTPSDAIGFVGSAQSAENLYNTAATLLFHHLKIITSIYQMMEKPTESYQL